MAVSNRVFFEGKILYTSYYKNAKLPLCPQMSQFLFPISFTCAYTHVRAYTQIGTHTCAHECKLTYTLSDLPCAAFSSQDVLLLQTTVFPTNSYFPFIPQLRCCHLWDISPNTHRVTQGSWDLEHPRAVPWRESQCMSLQLSGHLEFVVNVSVSISDCTFLKQGFFLIYKVFVKSTLILNIFYISQWPPHLPNIL